MNIVFLCYAVNPNQIDTYSGLSVAGNKMQTNIIKHLASYPDVNLKVIVVRPVAPYPCDKSILFRQNEGSIYTTKTIEVGFLNVPVLKQLTQSNQVYCQLKAILKNNSVEDTIILSFNMYPQIGNPIIKMIKQKGFKAVALLADLPIDYSVGRGLIGRILYHQYNSKTKKLIEQLKNVIVLNKYAAELYAPNADYLVIDGGIDISNQSEKTCPNELRYSEKNLLYCGALHRYSGALTLAESMKYIKDENVFLDIYGDGEDKDKILSLSTEDKRIRYHGRVDNDTMMQRQKEAFLLVNPRPIHDSISMVTFPSKIFEYMISGTPVLSTHLNGFSEEYNDKLLFVDDDSESGLTNGIIKALSTSEEELLQYSTKAYRYVVTQKDWKIQVLKIKKYLEKCLFIEETNNEC